MRGEDGDIQDVVSVRARSPRHAARKGAAALLAQWGRRGYVGPVLVEGGSRRREYLAARSLPGRVRLWGAA